MSRHAPRANDLLGNPADARLLIVDADDFGMCHSVNEGVLRAAKEAAVSSTTLMAPCPWAPHAMRLLQENPGLPFCVHLTVVCDFPHYRWGPLAPRDRMPSLVDEAGSFHAEDRVRALLERVRKSDLDFLVSREARDTLDEEGIVLLDFRALQKVWSGKPAFSFGSDRSR